MTVELDRLRAAVARQRAQLRQHRYRLWEAEDVEALRTLAFDLLDAHEHLLDEVAEAVGAQRPPLDEARLLASVQGKKVRRRS